MFLMVKIGSTDNVKNDRLNPYYCADFGSCLYKLSKHFISWMAVMSANNQLNSTFVELGDKYVASSTRSEEYFWELKHLVFKKEKSIRMDKYLVIHLRSIMGMNKCYMP